MLQPPYTRSKALLRINGHWITPNEKWRIVRARHRDRVWSYCKEKHNWSEEVIEMIMWSAIKKAWTGRTILLMVCTSKILHGWLPVMHMHGRFTGNTQCLGCEEWDETFNHMLRCLHDRMQEAWTQALLKVWESGIKQGLPTGFMNNVQQYLRLTLIHSEEEPDADLAQILISQQAIGHTMLVRGYLSFEWLRLLCSLDSHQPERKIARLIRILWDHLIDPPWSTQNDILHLHTNYVSENSHAQLGNCLTWYTQHREELLSRDQFLARHTLSEIEAMSTTSQCREWVLHLDMAWTAWAKEKTTLAKGQRLITQYFTLRESPG